MAPFLSCRTVNFSNNIVIVLIRWERTLRRTLILLGVICATTLIGLNANAQDNATRQTIEWLIPFREGGGSDTWARFNAPFLSKYLPGQPEVVVRNVPGGGSTKGTNRYALNAAADGTTLLGTSASTQFPFLLGDSRVRYDYADWRVLMVYPTGGVVYVQPELGVSDASELGELQSQKLIYGSQGATSLDLVPMLGFELIGLDVRPIFGIRGRSAGQLAFERGDTTIDYQTSAAYIRNIVPLVEEGKAVPLFSFGALDESGALVRDPQFPDLPHIGEIYEQVHGEAPSGIAWESWFAFFSAGFGAQKLLVLPRETPLNILRELEAALREMQRDPEYIARKSEVLGEYQQVTGDAARRLYSLATDIPNGPRRWIRNWLREEYDLNL